MDFGSRDVLFLLAAAIQFGFDRSDRSGRIEYHFDGPSSEKSIGAGALPDMGNMIIHGQTTWIDQRSPPFHAPYSGAQSLQSGFDCCYTSVRMDSSG
jgi:hypothetical protein